MPVCDQSISETSPSQRIATPAIRVALLGLGRVGSAVASLVRSAPRPIRVVGAFVRNSRLRRDADCQAVEDARALLDQHPDVLVEVLGGTTPAREIVLDALDRGIPVVTANKTLVAVHGDELLDAAARSHTRLYYEAAVIAGVPFLGTLGRRPVAGSCRRVEAVLNGTTNYILCQLEREGVTLSTALLDAQTRGYAEPDPSKDIEGLDAAEKLAVLVRHLGGLSVAPGHLPTKGISGLTAADLAAARRFGGALKHVAVAEWSGDEVRAFVGPALLPRTHPLAHLRNAENGIRIWSNHVPPIYLSGAGAGPETTAATILDDVIEAASTPQIDGCLRPARTGRCDPSHRSSWLLRLQSSSHLAEPEVSNLFAACGVWIRRWSGRERVEGLDTVWAETFPCSRDTIHAGLRAVEAATGGGTSAWPSLEPCPEAFAGDNFSDRC